MKHTSSCFCGQAKLSTDADPIRVSICYCYGCQKRTGSAFGLTARFARNLVNFEGTTSEYVRIEDDDSMTFHFCPRCGSTLYWAPDAETDTVATAVGNFADSSFPAPTISVFSSRKHAWVDMPNLETHEIFD